MNFNDAVYQRDGTIKDLEGYIKGIAEGETPTTVLTPDTEVDIEGEDPTTLENYIKDEAEKITLAPEMPFDLELETITLGAYVHNVANYEATQAASSKVSKTGDETISGVKTFSDGISFGEVSVTSDGVKTNGELLSELFALVNIAKLKGGSYLSLDGEYLNLEGKTASGTSIYFAITTIYAGEPNIEFVRLSSSAIYEHYYSGTNHAYTEQVPSAGQIFKVIY